MSGVGLRALFCWISSLCTCSLLSGKCTGILPHVPPVFPCSWERAEWSQGDLHAVPLIFRVSRRAIAWDGI